MNYSVGIQIVANGVAIVLSGLVAVWLSQRLQEVGDKRSVKLKVFTVLMANRADPLNPAYYNTLNIIDTVFHDEYEVRQAWAAYFEALLDPSLSDEAGARIRMQKEMVLLTQIARTLGIKRLSEVDVGHIYIPQGAADAKEIVNGFQREMTNCFKAIQKHLDQISQRGTIETQEHDETEGKTDQA